MLLSLTRIKYGSPRWRHVDGIITVDYGCGRVFGGVKILVCDFFVNRVVLYMYCTSTVHT